MLSTSNEASASIVFVHGTPGSKSHFKRYLRDEELQKRFNMLAIDRPGFGKSQSELLLNFKGQTKEISKLVQDNLPAGPVICIGHSYGAPLCLNLMIDEPQIFNKGLLIAGPYDFNRKILKWYNYLAKLPLLKYLVPRSLKNSNLEMYGLKEELRLLDSKLHRLQNAPDLLHGLKDGIVPVEDSDKLVKKLSHFDNINYSRWDKSGHLVIWNNFEGVKALILNLYEM